MSLKVNGWVLIAVVAFAPNLLAQQPPTKAPPVNTHDDHDHSGHDHDHAHPEHGLNDGDLIEIGHGEYYAEFVVDEKDNRVVVFLLDHLAKAYVPIDAPNIAINVKLKGKPMQFKLRAEPQKGEAKSVSSRFTMTSHELVDALHSKESDAKLSMKIGKKAFTAKVHLDHDHDDHDHAGHSHAEKPSTKGPRR